MARIIASYSELLRMQGSPNIVTIYDEDELYRRLSPVWRAYYAQNGRLSSAAFRPRKGRSLSVDLARLTTPETCLSHYPDCGLASLVAANVRTEGLDVEHTPQIDNHAHCDITDTITKSVAKRFATAARILVE